VPFRYALVNGWYYNATPQPSPALLGRVLWQGRRRAVKVLYNALIRVGRDPAAADHAVLADLQRRWREQQLPHYRRLVTAAETEATTAAPPRLVELVDQLGREACVALWYLAIVGGSAWKMESRLTGFVREHLAIVLPDADGGAQVLLRGLPGTRPTLEPHAVHSVDWYHPIAGELPAPPTDVDAPDRHAALAARRDRAEQRCATALADRPRLLAQFQQLLQVNQRYAAIREQQARTWTLAWPALRTCARRLGQHLADTRKIGETDDVFFCTRTDITMALAGQPAASVQEVAQRHSRWQQQCRLTAPLILGRAPRLIGDVIDHAVRRARGTNDVLGADGNVIIGHPASAGRATGPVRIITDPHEFATFREGEVLVAKATTPIWTPLFARAAAVVTDGGTLAAHASLVAREYGIPAVVGTGDATARLSTGQRVTVDGTTGTVTTHQP
jgi:pyruvate,water dikinase